MWNRDLQVTNIDTLAPHHIRPVPRWKSGQDEAAKDYVDTFIGSPSVHDRYVPACVMLRAKIRKGSLFSKFFTWSHGYIPLGRYICCEIQALPGN